LRQFKNLFFFTLLKKKKNEKNKDRWGGVASPTPTLHPYRGLAVVVACAANPN
jgi:hypothetical protein